MPTQAEKMLCQMAQESDYKPRSYSGRGMYGRECLGFACDSVDGFIEDIYERMSGTLMGDSTEAEVRRLLKGRSSDQMGRRYIVYFPSVKWDGYFELDDE